MFIFFESDMKISMRFIKHTKYLCFIITLINYILQLKISTYGVIFLSVFILFE